MTNRVIDSDCVSRLIQGEENAFAETYHAYGEKVYRLAFRFLKEAAESEEIVQETFIQLWLNRGKLDKERDLWLYLFVIAKRLSLNALRRMHSVQILTEVMRLETDLISEITENKIVEHDLELFTQKVISQLPPQQALCLSSPAQQGPLFF